MCAKVKKTPTAIDLIMADARATLADSAMTKAMAAGVGPNAPEWQKAERLLREAYNLAHIPFPEDD